MTPSKRLTNYYIPGKNKKNQLNNPLKYTPEIMVEIEKLIRNWRHDLFEYWKLWHIQQAITHSKHTEVSTMFISHKNVIIQQIRKLNITEKLNTICPTFIPAFINNNEPSTQSKQLLNHIKYFKYYTKLSEALINAWEGKTLSKIESELLSLDCDPDLDQNYFYN